MSSAGSRKTQKGAGLISQDEHVDCAMAGAEMHVSVPGEVKTEDFSVAWEKVGKDCLVRVELAADTYIAFADDATGGAVNVATSPAVKLPAGYHIIRATAPFMRASTNPTRVEVFF